jgi:hypothetical protein
VKPAGTGDEVRALEEMIRGYLAGAARAHPFLAGRVA